jgi:PKD domain
VTFALRRRTPDHDTTVELVAKPDRPPFRRAILVSLLACALLLILASSASALIVSIGGRKYGVQPHATKFERFSGLPQTVLQYGGGPVMHANAIYAIYWDPAKLRSGETGRTSKYHGEWIELIDQFFEGVADESNGLTSVFALSAQYTETGGARAAYNTIFRGSRVDTDTYPDDGCTDPDHALNENFACLTDEQLRAELRSYIAANKLPAGPDTLYYLFTPPDLTVCTDGGTVTGHCSDSARANPWTLFSNTPTTKEEEEKASYENSFCSYHSDTSSSSGETLLYAVIPWVAGTYGAGPEVLPEHRNGADCQDGTELLQEPNQILGTTSVDGYYDRGLPDVLVNQISAEQLATVTDPEFNGWFEPASGNEAPDQCRNWFEEPPIVQGSSTAQPNTEAGTFYNQTIGERNYYLNTEYNQAAAFSAYPGLRCELHTNLAPAFSAPRNANAHEVVGFDGAESNVTLGQSAAVSASSNPYYRATFTWNFGDGTTVSGPAYGAASPSEPLYASVFHTYEYGGEYDVTLTVQDAAGHVASTTNVVTIAGPARPSGGESAGGGSSTANTSQTTSASGASTSTTTGSPTATVSSPAAPVVATQTVASHSLSAALREGVVVRYSVNEQAAGRFEVMLASSIARRIGLRGAAATGLAPGTPRQTIIAKAILVTTKGGRSTYKIKFSKATAVKLRTLREVTLTIRLTVHNAKSPTVTTVLDTVNLH